MFSVCFFCLVFLGGGGGGVLFLKRLHLKIMQKNHTKFFILGRSMEPRQISC